MSAHVPGRSWFSSRQDGFSWAQGLVIEPTEDSERSVVLWVAVDNDGPTLQLDAKQCREVAAELVKRADLIDPDLIDAEIVEEVEA